MKESEKNKIQHVKFDPELVGWEGLPFAVEDALSLNVPLACKMKHLSRLRKELKKLNTPIGIENIQIL